MNKVLPKFETKIVERENDCFLPNFTLKIFGIFNDFEFSMLVSAANVFVFTMLQYFIQIYFQRFY